MLSQAVCPAWREMQKDKLSRNAVSCLDHTELCTVVTQGEIFIQGYNMLYTVKYIALVQFGDT